jgi:hypothetical protein
MKGIFKNRIVIASGLELVAWKFLSDGVVSAIAPRCPDEVKP